MADQYDKEHSDPQRSGHSGKERSVQTREDAEIHKIRNEDAEGAIPQEAGDDFTFPDEDSTLGRKAGDDLPGEKAKNRD